MSHTEWGMSQTKLSPVTSEHTKKALVLNLTHESKVPVLFEIMVQIKQKRGTGVKNPSPRNFWCELDETFPTHEWKNHVPHITETGLFLKKKNTGHAYWTRRFSHMSQKNSCCTHYWDRSLFFKKNKHRTRAARTPALVFSWSSHKQVYTWWIYISVRIYIYICTYVHIYVYMYICIYVYVKNIYV